MANVACEENNNKHQNVVPSQIEIEKHLKLIITRKGNNTNDLQIIQALLCVCVF